ncbi:hypothetical protein BD769DRAFT_1487040 [Suillus cothurnatus]|nr:hypothetical protein BD769DRAFT_1487040 [Suillus cothurnatus]
MKGIVVEELILSGTYQCTGNLEENTLVLFSMTWILPIIWEVFALSWITIGDPVTELMKIHVFYFASFVAISCFKLVYLSPTISVVCPSMTDLYVRSRFIIFIGHIFYGNPDVPWYSFDRLARPKVCARTTPHP